MKKVSIGLFVASVTLSQAAVSAVVLYNNNFDGASYPSYTTVFGSVQTVAPVLGNASNSLAFNSAGNTISNSSSFYYDQIQYAVNSVGSPYYGTSYNNFTVSFDVATSGLIGSANHFVVLFDTPSVRNLYFNNNGTISVANIGSGASGVIGNYVNNDWMHIDMNFDISSNLWSIYLDNSLLYSDSMDASNLGSIRFSQGLESQNVIDTSSTTFLDNVVISAVPLPGAIWFFGSGLLTLFGLRKKVIRE